MPSETNKKILKDIRTILKNQAGDNSTKRQNWVILGASLMLGSFGILQLKTVLTGLDWLIAILFAIFWLIGGTIIIFVIASTLRTIIINYQKRKKRRR